MSLISFSWVNYCRHFLSVQRQHLLRRLVSKEPWLVFSCKVFPIIPLCLLSDGQYRQSRIAPFRFQFWCEKMSHPAQIERMKPHIRKTALNRWVIDVLVFSYRFCFSIQQTARKMKSMKSPLSSRSFDREVTRVLLFGGGCLTHFNIRIGIEHHSLNRERRSNRGNSASLLKEREIVQTSAMNRHCAELFDS